MSRAAKFFAWVGALIVLLFMLMIVEGTGGHDGWLCEWGYDMDGEGTGDTGCG